MRIAKLILYPVLFGAIFMAIQDPAFAQKASLAKKTLAAITKKATNGTLGKIFQRGLLENKITRIYNFSGAVLALGNIGTLASSDGNFRQAKVPSSRIAQTVANRYNLGSLPDDIISISYDRALAAIHGDMQNILFPLHMRYGPELSTAIYFEMIENILTLPINHFEALTQEMEAAWKSFADPAKEVQRLFAGASLFEPTFFAMTLVTDLSSRFELYSKQLGEMYLAGHGSKPKRFDRTIAERLDALRNRVEDHLVLLSLLMSPTDQEVASIAFNESLSTYRETLVKLVRMNFELCARFRMLDNPLLSMGNNSADQWITEANTREALNSLIADYRLGIRAREAGF